MEFGVLLSTHVYLGKFEPHLTTEAFNSPVKHEEGRRGGECSTVSTVMSAGDEMPSIWTCSQL